MRRVRERQETQVNPLKPALKYYQMRAAWLGDGGHPVPKEQAQSRANICMRCPKNVRKPFWEFLAVPAIAAVQRQLNLKDDMALKVEGENSLHTCDGCECILKLKVWTPIKHIIDTTDIDALHADCWIRSEAKP